jgi:hypothetical protein
VALILFASICWCQENTSLDARVNRLANAQKNWGPRMNTPGTEIHLTESRRERSARGTVVYYRLSATGLPGDAVYTLFSTTLGLQSTPVLEGVTFDRSGQAVCAGTPGTCQGEKPNDPIDLAILAARGEPKRFAVLSEDKESKAFAYVVPFPIMGKDRGCSVEAVLLTAKAEAVLIHGSGFAPGTAVDFRGVSEGEVQHSRSNAQQDGRFYEVALPYVKGKARGKAKVTLESSACSPSLSFDWGEGADRNQ